MLLAVAADDPSRFDSIWELDHRESPARRPPPLVAVEDGGVVDEQPASDADLDAARALVLAGDAFDRDDLRRAGRGAGHVRVLDEMTAETSLGRILLPGPWATASPHAYNPVVRVTGRVRRARAGVGDPRWAEVAEAVAPRPPRCWTPTRSPTDWPPSARTARWRSPDPPEAGANRDTATTRRARRSASPNRATPTTGLWPHASPPRCRRTRCSPRSWIPGGPRNPPTSTPSRTPPVPRRRRRTDDRMTPAPDLRRMAETAASTPTYYGSAWNALTAAMLSSDVLGGCPGSPTAPTARRAQGTTAPGIGAAAGSRTPSLRRRRTRRRRCTSHPAIGSTPTSSASTGERTGGSRRRGLRAVGWYEKGVLPARWARGSRGPCRLPDRPGGVHRPPPAHPGGHRWRSSAPTARRRLRRHGAADGGEGQLPTESIYAPTPTPQLRLVTCAGHGTRPAATTSTTWWSRGRALTTVRRRARISRPASPRGRLVFLRRDELTARPCRSPCRGVAEGRGDAGVVETAHELVLHGHPRMPSRSSRGSGSAGWVFTCTQPRPRALSLSASRSARQAWSFMSLIRAYSIDTRRPSCRSRAAATSASSTSTSSSPG